MHKVSLIMAYYDNPGMLKKQCENIASYSEDVRRNLELIIIDDCSPRWPAWIEINPGVPVRIFRTKVDVPWNQDFCRNLGSYMARNEWLFLTDIDHLIPDDTMENVMKHMNLKKMVAYRFTRVSAPLMQPYKLHPNTWFMTREFYCYIGGYDERFAGNYGTDGDFRDRITSHSPIENLPWPIIRVGREVIPDASTTTLQRKLPEHGQEIARLKRERGNAEPILLSFAWEEVYNSEGIPDAEIQA